MELHEAFHDNATFCESLYDSTVLSFVFSGLARLHFLAGSFALDAVSEQLPRCYSHSLVQLVPHKQQSVEFLHLFFLGSSYTSRRVVEMIHIVSLCRAS